MVMAMTTREPKIHRRVRRVVMEGHIEIVQVKLRPSETKADAPTSKLADEPIINRLNEAIAKTQKNLDTLHAIKELYEEFLES